MKKVYYKPTLKCFKVRTVNVLAASPEVDIDSNSGGDGSDACAKDDEDFFGW